MKPWGAEMKRGAALLSIFVFSVTCYAATWPELAKDAEFESRWMCNPSLSSFIPIAKTLVSNNVKGCGVLYWAESKDYENIFLVACYSASADLGGDPTSLYVLKTDSKKLIRTRKSMLKTMPDYRPSMEPSCE